MTTPTAKIIDVQYTPGMDAVVVTSVPTSGLYAGVPLRLPTTQTALAARVVGGGNWGDAECVAEAQAVLDAQGGGYTVVTAV